MKISEIKPQAMALILILGGALYLSIISQMWEAVTALVVGLMATLKELLA